MKTRILLIGFVLAAFSFYSTLNAQITGNTALGFVANATGTIDTVTVGSVMPYRVTGDINFHALRLQGLFELSKFNWSVTGTATGFELRDNSGNPGSTTLGAKDTVVSVNWKETGTYHVLTTEVPVPAAGMPAISCTAPANDLQVLVVSRPTAAWPSATLGGCGVAGTKVSLPVTVTGTGKFDIKYKITYTNLAGTTTDFVASNTVTVGSYQANQTSVSLPDLSIPANTYGTYTVIIEDFSDRISRKSGIATIVGTDRPDKGLKVYSYPAPTTQSIQYIKNIE